ncbi:hypothetical protein PR048_025905 [Dryococelus australis]|uniref:Uncharacterized protein n=1 Tax=Dryococelus australis TaxID=614101 RepID=A0ABQ9GJT7_9NEOP|nr:hypothetical protein PR048_025905 [Dryococelus australis]
MDYSRQASVKRCPPMAACANPKEEVRSYNLQPPWPGPRNPRATHRPSCSFSLQTMESPTPALIKTSSQALVGDEVTIHPSLSSSPRISTAPLQLKLNTVLDYTRQKSKSKYRNNIRLERASQKQSSDTHKTPYDRVKRCRERRINMKASEPVNVEDAASQLADILVSIKSVTSDLERSFFSSAWNGLEPRKPLLDHATVAEVSLLASHQGDPGSIPGRVTPDFLMWKSCRWSAGFLGISRFPRPFIPALPHSHLTPPSSALEISMLRSVQISSLTHSKTISVIVWNLYRVYLNPTNKLHKPVRRERFWNQPSIEVASVRLQISNGRVYWRASGHVGRYLSLYLLVNLPAFFTCVPTLNRGSGMGVCAKFVFSKPASCHGNMDSIHSVISIHTQRANVAYESRVEKSCRTSRPSAGLEKSWKRPKMDSISRCVASRLYETGEGLAASHAASSTKPLRGAGVMDGFGASGEGKRERVVIAPFPSCRAQHLSKSTRTANTETAPFPHPSQLRENGAAPECKGGNTGATRPGIEPGSPNRSTPARPPAYCETTVPKKVRRQLSASEKLQQLFTLHVVQLHRCYMLFTVK